ncbi:hypothetical protein CROQUDRAFT_649801 [Cronartium quercuum f. sp. fusiforme G11]|uniref:O-fucosyltransferase family protein n=1 Tax=Cronartium quercuum f. sp. fusiforme G11 TaxID=708437 RepID=A0A9P6TJ40_9BASI|nr:hypothetical protein CROQUDRAFT_649801 [Cronartium quercuum f. sp. fusiforme G11]
MFQPQPQPQPDLVLPGPHSHRLHQHDPNPISAPSPTRSGSRFISRSYPRLVTSPLDRFRISKLVPCLLIFSLAFILFRPSIRPPPASLLPSAVLISPHLTNQSTIELDPFPLPRPKPFIRPARYLSYLPHSGYHNQRISLENALTLAHALNRTLLLPPCFLGSPVPFIRSDKLAHRLATAASKAGLEHCRSPAALQARECLGSATQTTLGWDQLIDVRSLNKLVSLLDLPQDAYTPTAQALALHLHPFRDVYTIFDERVYDHRYSLVASPADTEKLGKFEKWVDVHHQLGGITKPLLVLGSLFGSARIHDPSRQARTPFREAMIPHSALLETRASEIVEALGGPDSYWAAHVRLGDSVFRAEGASRAQAVVEGLVTGPMELPLSFLTQAMNRAQTLSLPGSKCRGQLHQAGSGLEKFNRKLYIATDAPVPRSEPALAPFFTAFPCTVLLDDHGLGSALGGLVNGADGVNLGGLFAPLLDAIVAGRAKGVVGTEGSTFSRFVVDVLFPTYHHLPIIERG